jgi:protein O-mannosyl-transferase
LIPGGLLLLGSVLLAVAGWKTQRRASTFGLLWLAITILPVSNVVVRSGVLLAERTLFLPSVGVLVACGSLWTWVAARIATLRRPASLAAALSSVAALAIVLALGMAKSATRTRVWRNSDAFFSQIVEDAPLSYRAQHLHGMWLFEHGRRSEGEQHVRTAIAMFPYDAGPFTDLADQYRLAGLCEPARELYRRAIELGTLRDRARMGLVICLLHDAQYAEAAAEARRGASSASFQAEQFARLVAIADSAVAATSPVRQSGVSRRRRR